MRVKHRHVTLAEMPDGRWLYKERGLYRASLGRLLRVVQQDNDEMAIDGRMAVVTHIKYKPRTDAGTMLVLELMPRAK